MKLLPIMLALAVFTAGCATPSDNEEGVEALKVPLYRFAYEGSDNFIEGTGGAFMFRVDNNQADTMVVSLVVSGFEEALLGTVGQTGGDSREVYLPVRANSTNNAAPVPLQLAPAQSGAFLGELLQMEGSGELSAQVIGTTLDQVQVFSETIRWNVTVLPAATPATPGDHIQTITVGIFTDGSSFYTNIPSLGNAQGFRANFSEEIDGTPLPIYVFGSDRSEQPEGSKDTCHFTTIEGYNALMKKQASGSTGVRYLRPEAAYTLEGNEAHPLYGYSLIFMNTVVAHDGATTTMDIPPNPLGECFMNRVGSLPVPGFE